MVNCEECIHYEPCMAWAIDDLYNITSNVFCDYFKDKSLLTDLTCDGCINKGNKRKCFDCKRYQVDCYVDNYKAGEK